jgi:hypothetical protein
MFSSRQRVITPTPKFAPADAKRILDFADGSSTCFPAKLTPTEIPRPRPIKIFGSIWKVLEVSLVELWSPDKLRLSNAFTFIVPS